MGLHRVPATVLSTSSSSPQGDNYLSPGEGTAQVRLGTWVSVSQWQGADLGHGICSIRVPLPSGSGQRASPPSLGVWLSRRHAWRKASSCWVNSEAPQGGRETSLPSPAAGGSWTAGGSQSAELPAWLEVGEAEVLAGWAAGGPLPGSFLPPQVCHAV